MYRVVKVNTEERLYFQVKKEGVVYPPLPGYAVTILMADGIPTAQEAVKLRDKLSAQYGLSRVQETENET